MNKDIPLSKKTPEKNASNAPVLFRWNQILQPQQGLWLHRLWGPENWEQWEVFERKDSLDLVEEPHFVDVTK